MLLIQIEGASRRRDSEKKDFMKNTLVGGETHRKCK